MSIYIVFFLAYPLNLNETVHMHKNEALGDCLMAVITAQEAAFIWRLSRNAVSDACRRGTLRGRKSGQTWLITIFDMLSYQNGRYWPERIPDDLRPAFESAIVKFRTNP
jgi:hypothetical protein